MDIRHLFIGFIAAAAILAGCQPKEEDFGVARIEVSTSSLEFGPSSSSQTLMVTASREWTVTGLPDWIAVDPAGGQPSKDAQTVTLTVIPNTGYNRTADIAFTIGISKEYVTVFQAGERGEVDLGKGTVESPFSVDGVIAYINGLDNPSAESPQQVYVKGKVSSIVEEYTTQYGNGTFYISDDGSTSATQFYAYRVKYLGNKGFSSKDEQVKVGDDVIVFGNVILFGSSNPVYETAQNTAYLYSLNGKTEGTGTVTADPKGTGSKEDPFNVAAAIKAVEGLSWTSNNDYEKTGPYYVKGMISRIGKDSKTGEDLTFTQSATYSNATFYICDDGFEDAEFYAYRVAYVGNKTFVAGKSDIKVGDEVVIYGELMNYKGNTPETVQGTSYLYSLNGVTDESTPPVTADPKGTGSKEDPFNVAAAIKAVEGLSWTSNSSYEKTGPYYVKGRISKIAKDSKTGDDLTYTQSGTYSNASFYICDDGFENAEFYGYRVAYVGNKTYTSDKPDIKVGDEVVIYGELMNYKGNTPETVQNTAYLYSLNGTSDEGGDEPAETDHGATTVADFLAAAESNTDWYELTGVISNLKDGDKFGNFDLTDDSGSVYVYGVLSTKGGEKKQFQELVSQYGIANGGTITIKANRGSFTDNSGNKKDEAVNAYFISYKAAEGGDEPGGDEPGGDEPGGDTPAVDFTSNLEWTLGTNAYSNEATVNGVENVSVLKLGTSTKPGEATVKLPAGTTKVTFYGVSWKGKVASVAFKVGSDMVYKQELAANDGASNNSPFTLSVTDSDKYTYTLSAAAADETTVTITTDGSNTRVILFAVKAE